VVRPRRPSVPNENAVWSRAYLVFLRTFPRGCRHLLRYVFGVAYSPDGKRLATASGGGTVQVYALDPRELLTLARSRVTGPFTADQCQRYF
jgi:hypothetical protein